jgi:hypothetical protein
MGGGGFQIISFLSGPAMEPGVQRIIPSTLPVLLQVVPRVYQINPATQVVEQLPHHPP